MIKILARSPSLLLLSIYIIMLGKEKRYQGYIGGKALKLLVMIPAYNEAENIERVVDNLIRNYHAVRLCGC